MADAPSCFDGGDKAKAHLEGSNPSPPVCRVILIAHMSLTNLFTIGGPCYEKV